GGQRAGEPDDDRAAAAGEEPGRLGLPARDHPRLVGLPRRRGRQPGDDEHRAAVGADDDRPGRARERDAAEGARPPEPVVQGDVPGPERDRGGEGERGGGGERPRPRPEAGARRRSRPTALRPGGGEDALAQAGRRDDRGGRVAERRRRALERGDLLAAARADGEVALVGARLLWLERV